MLVVLQPAAEAVAPTAWTWPEAAIGIVVTIVLGALAWKFMDILR